LGITGAIYKRLWLLDKDIEQLNRAINYYGKCFKIRSDYYTGENYALCLEFMSKENIDADEKIYFKIEAKRTRERIINLLSEMYQDESFKQRNDKMWVYATLANCYFAVDNTEKAKEFEALFELENPVDWETQTFLDSKDHLLNLKK